MAERAQVVGQRAGRGTGLSVVAAQLPSVEVVGVLEQGPRGLLLAAGLQEDRGLPQQPADLHRDVVERAAGIGRREHVRDQAAPGGPARGVGRIRGDRGVQEAHCPCRPASAVGALVGGAADEMSRGHPVQLHALLVDPDQAPAGERGGELRPVVPGECGGS